MMDEKELKKPLRDGLEYYDATPSIEQCLDMISRLKETIELQGGINFKLIEAIRDLQLRIEIIEGKGHKPSSLLLPPGLTN
jgi:hypothetical protein